MGHGDSKTKGGHSASQAPTLYRKGPKGLEHVRTCLVLVVHHPSMESIVSLQQRQIAVLTFWGLLSSSRSGCP